MYVDADLEYVIIFNNTDDVPHRLTADIIREEPMVTLTMA